jgi:D-glycero-D-manno-heptose 1,7-bisphosphate phosphatase
MGKNQIIRKAVFLDRDGVINKNVFYHSSNEWESPRILNDFCFIDGALEAIRKLYKNGFKIFIVTNQPSYAKGKTTLKSLKKIMKFCNEKIRAHDIKITKTYINFNHPRAIHTNYRKFCVYRKPSPQAIIDAINKHNLIKEYCWIIGDRDTDIECGISANINTIKVKPDYEKILIKNKVAKYNANDITEAVELILKS